MLEGLVLCLHNERLPVHISHSSVVSFSFPGANNQTLLSQFNNVHKSNPYFESPVVKEDAFIIKHYAGKVKYHIKVRCLTSLNHILLKVLQRCKSLFKQTVAGNCEVTCFAVARAVSTKLGYVLLIEAKNVFIIVFCL